MDEIKKLELSNRVFYLAVVLIAGVFVSFVGGVFYQFSSLPQNYPQEITVSGEGKVYAKPDIAMVSLGLKTEGNSVKDITQTNITAMNSIIADLKKLGIEDKDIQTTQYSITPQYNWTEKNGQVPNGYAVEQSVSVKIRNFEKIGNVFEIATNHGANTVGGLQFSIDDPAKVQADAREKAIAEAKNKALVLAKQSGLSIVKLVNISEGYASPSPMMYSKDAVGMGSNAELSIAPTIQPGQTEVNTTVYLTYRVR